MNDNSNINLPPSLIDLAFLLMFIFMLTTVAFFKQIKNEYQTEVDLFQHKVIEGKAPGSSQMSFAITEEQGKYSFAIESKKIGKKVFAKLQPAIEELKRLHPPTLVIRADKDALYRYPQEVFIQATAAGIRVGIASQEVN